jgi:hypothetical protein
MGKRKIPCEDLFLDQQEQKPSQNKNKNMKLELVELESDFPPIPNAVHVFEEKDLSFLQWCMKQSKDYMARFFVSDKEQ